jgi:hypothetical protein
VSFLPPPYALSLLLSVERLHVDAFGRTEVTASFAGSPLRPFTLARNVDVEGWDTIRPDVESAVIGLVQDALDLAR